MGMYPEATVASIYPTVSSYPTAPPMDAPQSLEVSSHAQDGTSSTDSSSSAEEDTKSSSINGSGKFANWREKIDVLKELGFRSAAENVRALVLSRGEMESAVNILLESR